ncbi:MAG: hypothetical protein Kow0040_14790 [Thermogutta sp.]
MGYLDNLIAARDRYLAALEAAQQGPPTVEWNEHQRYLVEQIEKLEALIAKATEQERAAESEQISGGFTP